MKSDTITYSFVMDKNVYNAFKSIVSSQGQNVKSNIIRYMQSVIQYGTPNADTILAVQEVEALKKDSNKKLYSSFNEILEELADDE